MKSLFLFAETDPRVDWMNFIEQARQWVTLNGLSFLRNLVAAVAIFLIGRMVANFIKRLIVKLLDARKLDQTVSRFAANVASTVIMIMVIISALGQLGIPTAQFAALIAAAGLAIGLALQGNLSNFAAGFLLVFFRPFKKGDYVSGGGAEGFVDEIGVFTTTITTVDHKLVIIPNSKLTADNIINFTANENRRVDLTFVAGAQNKPSTVRDLLLEVATSNPKVLKSPAPEALLKDCNGRLTFELRAWCSTANYWDVYFGLIDTVAVHFTVKEIGAPVPLQMVQIAK